ncbi:MAG: YceH family protein [Rubripirellula sp.]
MSDETGEDKKTAGPLSAGARRVLGVLIEKAKTTPDNYPLTLASLISGCNQKSNRDPKMDMDDEDTLLALDELKAVGAAREVQGSGRAVKYRHVGYEWLDVDGPGSAVMTELLLRGAQTLGELRTRASRMHPFSDLSVIQTTVDGLIEKGLVEAITPAGRGQMFAHKLYTPQDRQYLVARIEKHAAAEQSTASPARESKSSGNPVDALLARLETVSERIDALEKRIAELES